MKNKLTFFLLLIASCSGFSRDTLFVHSFLNDENSLLEFSDSLDIYVDRSNELTIEDILALPNEAFAANETLAKFQLPFTAWSRIRLVNNTKKTCFKHLAFRTFIDSISMYTVENGEVVEVQFTGKVLPPAEKSLLGNCNCLPFFLSPGQSKDFYFEIKYDSVNSYEREYLLGSVYVVGGELSIRSKYSRYSGQYFYAGIMVLFSAVGLFMFALFRERAFVSFSLLMLSFTWYFLEEKTFISGLLNIIVIGQLNTFHLMASSGVVLSVFYFVSHYIQLARHFPKLHQYYFGISLLIAAFPILIISFFEQSQLLINIHSVLILLWAICGLAPVLLLARKGDKSAKTLLIAVAFLFVGNLIDTLQNLSIIPYHQLLSNSFQIGTVFLAGILFYDLFTKINAIRAEKDRFAELDQLKSSFFTNISHEFRTPLTLIMGPVQEVSEKTKDPDDRKMLQIAYQNANRLLQLINQVLDLSKLEVGKMEMRVQEQDFATLLKGIVMSFESLADRRNIQLQFVSEKEVIPLFIDQDKVEKIFYNLLSNAFKFTEDYGEISVLISEKDQAIEVRIKDNGIGIPENQIESIFNRFHQVDQSETRGQEGTGIGLALVKELVHLHSGSISAKSKEGKGTTIIVRLLLGNAHFSMDQLEASVASPLESPIPAFISTERINLKETPAPLKPLSASKLPVVLVIEDNADVRTYIKQYLHHSFQILEAVNGEEGILKALKYLPDLIISDVMMPKKGGYEVCAELKTDPRTSHIPVILLTAKATREEKLQGLETGADDYLIKPFDTKELVVRANNLIELRTRLRKQFSENSILKAQPSGINSVDKAFFEKVYQTVSENVSNQQFSAEDLAKAVSMSRVNLNRKLKTLTDHSANKYIQNFRLQTAFELLRQKSGNVSEIAIETGFGSTAYFVKCFREKYGKTPGTLLEE